MNLHKQLISNKEFLKCIVEIENSFKATLVLIKSFDKLKIVH